MSAAAQAHPWYDEAAERALLGAVLLAPVGLESLRSTLEPVDFYRPAHQHIAAAALTLARAGTHVDPATVAEMLGREGLLESAGGTSYLVTLTAEAPSTTGAPHWAEVVAERSTRRALRSFADGCAEAAADLSVPLEDVLDDARTRLSGVAAPVAMSTPSPTVDELLAVERPLTWCLPDLMARGDRALITAREGGGKTLFLYQLAVKAAAGIASWGSHRVRPVSVLIVECENGLGRAQRRLRALRAKVAAGERAPKLGEDGAGHFEAGRLRIEVRDDGLDLLTRADRHWLAGRIASCKPDLLVIGPLYKLITGNPNDEEPAKKCARFLDSLRDCYGLTLIIEAHSPHGDDLRPYGASLWRRWPDFGFGLRPMPKETPLWELHPWRPPRDDDREWPHRLRRGGEWPWMSVRREPTEEDI